MQSDDTKADEKPDEACALLRYAIDSDLAGYRLADYDENQSPMEGDGSNVNLLISLLENERLETRKAKARAAESERLLIVEKRRADAALAVTVELTRKSRESEEALVRSNARIQDLEVKLFAVERDRDTLLHRNHEIVSASEASLAKAEVLAQILGKREDLEDLSSSKAERSKGREDLDASLQIEVDRLTHQVDILLRERALLLASFDFGVKALPPADRKAVAPSSYVTEEMSRKEKVEKALQEYRLQREIS